VGYYTMDTTDSQRTVVIIDDEPAIVEMVCDVLEDEQIVAIRCPHGNEAFPCIRRQQPSLAILDLQMPIVDGIEIFQLLRADPRTMNIPVIFLTANAHMLRERLPQYPAMKATLLPKPFNVITLLTLVEQLLPSEGSR
jgi:CheY-like chemotaxis protein